VELDQVLDLLEEQLEQIQPLLAQQLQRLLHMVVAEELPMVQGQVVPVQ
jgi:hypothetical protein